MTILSRVDIIGGRIQECGGYCMLDTRILGENIRNLRKKSGLTQQGFAEAIGVSF